MKSTYTGLCLFYSLIIWYPCTAKFEFLSLHKASVIPTIFGKYQPFSDNSHNTNQFRMLDEFVWGSVVQGTNANTGSVNKQNTLSLIRVNSFQMYYSPLKRPKKRKTLLGKTILEIGNTCNKTVKFAY